MAAHFDDLPHRRGSHYSASSSASAGGGGAVGGAGGPESDAASVSDSGGEGKRGEALPSWRDVADTSPAWPSPRKFDAVMMEGKDAGGELRRAALPTALSGTASDDSVSERVVLNVGGRRFECFASTLSAYPDTLLGAMFMPRNRHLIKLDASGEVFFDRDPDAFSVILNFYRTHRLIVPPSLPHELVREECAYFQLPHADAKDTTEVLMWGRGEFGQLGSGDRRSTWMPQTVEVLRGVRVVQLSLGTSHSAALTEAGKVFTWGYGGDGRLGHGDQSDMLVPKALDVLADEHVVQVVCGELHTAALTDDGRLFTWGLGKDGRLGLGTTESHHVPRAVEFSRGVAITQVACGGLHTAALTSDGQVLTWGLGASGRLGHGDELDQMVPTLVRSLAGTPMQQVLCGGHHSAALSGDGRVFTWGFDDDGRLGHGVPGHQFVPKLVEALLMRTVVQIACGCWHSAALTSDGAAWTWGSCKSGQLGTAAKNSSATPRVVLQGKGGGIVSIACGTAHTAALARDGTVFTWGKHDDGRLGVESTADQTYPRAVTNLVERGLAVQQVVCGVYDTAVVAVSVDTFAGAATPRVGAPR